MCDILYDDLCTEIPDSSEGETLCEDTQRSTRVCIEEQANNEEPPPEFETRDPILDDDGGEEQLNNLEHQSENPHEGNVEHDTNAADVATETDAAAAIKLRRGRTRCIKLSRNGINEREALEFNALGQVCSPNASVFANWCGCIVRRRTNVPLQVKDWKNIPRDPVDFEAKLLDQLAVSFCIR